MRKKKITFCVPCYNEEGNVERMYDVLTDIMQEYLEKYDYEIIFSDNASTDTTSAILKRIAAKDNRVKVIINLRNYGVGRSGKNATYSASGDAVISLACDFQEPPELIPEFLALWEDGAKVVLGQKEATENGFIDRKLRNFYYAIIKAFSEVPQYQQVTGFGLIDKMVWDQIRELNEPDMATRHLIAELGYMPKFVPYTQRKRTEGKSSYNFWRFIDFGIVSLISTSRRPLRLMTLFGLVASLLCFAIGIGYFLYKILNWDSVGLGTAPILIGVFFVGAMQLFFFGILGEYIAVILGEVRSRPLVVESERINFEKEDERSNEHR